MVVGLFNVSIFWMLIFSFSEYFVRGETQGLYYVNEVICLSEMIIRDSTKSKNNKLLH